MPRRSWTRAAATLLLGGSVATLSACTASLPTNVALTWGGCAQSGGSTEVVTIAVPKGEEWPVASLEALSGVSGVGYRQVVVDATRLDEVGGGAPLTSVDVLVGSDPLWLESSGVKGVLTADSMQIEGGVDSVRYGHDASCLLANRTWFSANNVAMPSQLSDLTAEQQYSVAAISDPFASPSALALLPLWSVDWEVFEGFSTGSAGAQSGAQSGANEEAASADTAPGIVGSALVPLRHPNNLATDTQFKVLPDSCVRREVSAVPVATAADRVALAKEFVDLLTSPQGQQILAEHAVAYPLDPSIALTGAVSWADIQPAYPDAEILTGLKEWVETF